MTAAVPSRWSSLAVGEVATFVRGVTFKKHEASSQPGRGLVPIVRAGNLQDGRVRVDEDLVYVPGERVAPEQYLRSGDTLIATSSGSLSVVGKSALVRSDWTGAHGAFMAVLRPHPEIQPAYLSYWLKSDHVRGLWRGAAAGTNINNLKRNDLLATGVPVPSLDEQDRIVATIEEHFSHLDAAEHALAAAHRRLDALYRSVAVDAFDRPDWDWTTLGEIAEVKGGITKDSKREADPEFEEFPYLRVANVQRGYLDLANVTTIRANPRKAQRLVLCPGDILFNEGGDRDKLGRGWVWEGQIEDCIHQNHVFRARLLDDRFDPYFVSLHANSWGQQWFEAHGKQTTNLASLNLTTLKSFPVPVPPLEEQRAVASRLRSAFDSIQHQLLELDRVAGRSSSLRRSILAEAFAGRLVHDDSQDESAELLAAVHRQA